MAIPFSPGNPFVQACQELVREILQPNFDDGSVQTSHCEPIQATANFLNGNTVAGKRRFCLELAKDGKGGNSHLAFKGHLLQDHARLPHSVMPKTEMGWRKDTTQKARPAQCRVAGEDGCNIVLL